MRNGRGVLIVVCFFSCSLCIAASAGDAERRGIACGRGCIEVVCRYHGRIPDPAILDRHLAPNEFNENTMKQLAACAEALGLGHYAFKGTIADLKRLRDPAILHFTREHGGTKRGHYLVVLWSIRDNRLMAYDPSFSGLARELTDEQLEHHWTGKGLIVCPQPVPEVVRVRWWQIALPVGIGLVAALLSGGVSRRSKRGASDEEHA
ncbi:MAG TPA: cysteine peptidase family C39 domain-containing protein [Phycisphaerae bacterium]|nr:cysteine peptidase family C39 domain-containing protein [Phycisphaerae bacterium]